MRKSLVSLWKVLVLFLLTTFWPVDAQHFDHSLLDTLLQAHFVDGLVDYPALMRDGTRLRRYCELLRSVELQDFLSWSKPERKAFWVNAHNVLSLVGVIAYYPTDDSGQPVYYKGQNFSVQSIKNFRDRVFMKLMGMNITLNQIRDEILHDEYPDTRVYFALVHAAKGGPLFTARAFNAENIDELLDQATLAFVNNPNYVRLDQETNTLHLSTLFRWHRSEFPCLHLEGLKWVEYNRDLRGVVEFVYQLRPEADRSFIKKYSPRIRWIKFDWSLNLVAK